MEVFKAIKKRRSVRKFDSTKEVTDEQIEKLLEAARWAPSAGNLQSWFFIIIKDRKKKEKLSEAAWAGKYLAHAPVIIVSCADIRRCAARYGDKNASVYAIQDATIASQNICLTATDMGLASVWIGGFYEDSVAKILDLPSYLRPIALLPIGYPAESPSPPPRRSIKEISKEI